MLSKAKAKAAEAQKAAVAAGKEAKDAAKAAGQEANKQAGKAATKAKAKAAEVSKEGGGMGVGISFPSDKEVDASIVPRSVTKEGWLHKAGGADGSKPKKKRWFVIGDFAIAYYDKKGGSLKGTIDLRQTTEFGPSDAAPFEMNLVQKDGRFFRIFGASEPERENWLHAIASFAGYVTGRAEALERLGAAVGALTERLAALADGATAAAESAAATPDALGARFPASGEGVGDRAAAVEALGLSAAQVEEALGTVKDCEKAVAALGQQLTQI